MLVSILEGFRRLGRDSERVRHRQLALPAKPFAQGFALDVRHHIEQVAVGVARVVERQNVRVLQARRRLDLAQESLGAQGRGEIGMQDLERNAALVPHVARDVDGGHPASAEDRVHVIASTDARWKRADHVELFDGVLTRLVPHAELVARANLAERLSLLANAPRGLVGQLAHGQRQWVELGLVLSTDPALILLDEPAAGMTHDEVYRTAELVREINRSKALIVVEHDMQFIRMIAKQVTVFNQGSVLVEDSVANIMRNPQVRDIYLGKQAAA